MVEYTYIVLDDYERDKKHFETEKSAREYIGCRVMEIWMDKHDQGDCVDAKNVERGFRILVIREETNPVYFNGKNFGKKEEQQIFKIIDSENPS